MTSRKTKQGAASMYIVVFTTMVLIIIALSFVRIILAESVRTLNESLSQSAYNSALAGVEDGKVLILKYQTCLNAYGTSSNPSASSECKKILAFFESGVLKDAAGNVIDECDTVSYLLYGSTGQHSLSNDHTDSTSADGSDGIAQSYTCVRISNAGNYVRSTDEDSNSILVPVYVNNGNIDSLDSFTISWHKSDDGSSLDEYVSSDSQQSMAIYGADITRYNDREAFDGNAKKPALVRVDIMQSAGNFSLSDFYTGGVFGGTAASNRSSILLYPGSNTNVPTVDANAVAASSAKAQNYPTAANCDMSNADYLCKATIQVPKAYTSNSIASRNYGTFLLNISFPYGLPEKIDFELNFFDKDGAEMKLKNVQYIIDATGRANDLFRRVEARIDPRSDNIYGPEYELQVGASDGSGGEIKKNFRITDDCFTQNWNESEGTVRPECKDGKDDH